MEICSYLRHLIEASFDVATQPYAEVDLRVCNVRLFDSICLSLLNSGLAMHVPDSAFLGKA